MPSKTLPGQRGRAFLVWIGAVGLADYWTGYERSMMIFYLIPITLGTWFVGRSFGMFLAGFSVGTSIFTDLASGIPEVRYWNEAVGLSSYAIFVWLLARWRGLAPANGRTGASPDGGSARGDSRTNAARKRDDGSDRAGAPASGTRSARQSLPTSYRNGARGPGSSRKTGFQRSEDAAEARKLIGLIEEGIDLTRNLARGLFSPDLEQGGLAVALEGLAYNTQERTGISCEFHHNDESEIGSCRTGVLTQLYRIAQEAVTNAVKHAHAQRIVLELDAADGEMRLNIFDDGMGLGEASETTGLGLKMMRHGAGLIGAVSAQPDAIPGTLVSCVLPEGLRPSPKERDEI